MNRTTRLLSMFALAAFLFSFTGCIDKAKDKLIEQVVVEANKQFPVVIDPITTIESCEAVPGGIIKYNYVMDVDLSQIDTALVKEALTDNLLYILKNNKEIEPLKAAKVTFLHSYKTKNGETICEIELGPDDNKTANIKEVLSDDEIYKILQRNAVIMNLNKGMKVDQITTVKEAKAIHPRTVEYSYLLSVDGKDVDTTLFLSRMRPNMIREIKNNNREIMTRNNNVTFRHVYFDQNDKYICSISIIPEDYK